MNKQEDIHMDRQALDQIAEAAGYWDARLRAPDCTEADRARFAQWRDAASSHRAAFEKLQTLIATFRGGMSRADVRGFRDAARAVVQRRQRRQVWAAAASIALTLTGAALWMLLPENNRWAPVHVLAALAHTEYYSTDIGERSTITLRDGSSVELNTRTRLKVHFSDAQRSVELLDGQALFHVAKNPQRPFIVRAGDREIVAVGTAFDVRVDASSVRVTLLEGKVEVDRSGKTDSPRQSLEPGQQLIARLSSVRGNPADTAVRSISEERKGSAQVEDGAVVRTIDVSKVTGWRDGRVFLEDLSLADALAEMNRYSPMQITVDDPALAQLRVNGMFRAGEQEAFVAALRDYFPISVKRRGDTEIILTAAKSKSSKGL